MNLLIIQARMGSTRLPGKVLKKIMGSSLLEILIKRIAPASLVHRMIVATTTNSEDDKIAKLCEGLKIDCFRGSENDVLDRYYQAAKPYRPETVIRVTSDCVLHHHSVVEFVIGEYMKSEKDYFSNSNHEPDILEDGFDTEVFSFEALEYAWKNAKLNSEREHVTPYIKNCGRFACGWKKFNPAYNYKLSVDTENDFKLVAEIFGRFGTLTGFGLPEIKTLLDNDRELRQINADSVANAGFRKSLEDDKKTT